MIETAIIGNGPAGMCAADQLRHRDAVVVAPEETPSPSTCGGVLTTPAINHLKKQDLFGTIVPDGGRRLSSLAVAHGAEVLIEKDLDGPGMVSFRRDRFDRMLYEELDVGSIDRITDYVQGVERVDGSFQLNLRDGDSLRAEGIVDASGHRRVTGSDDNRSDQPLIGIEWQLDDQLPDPDRLLLVLGDQGYAGLTSTPGNQTTVSAVFRRKQDQPRQFDERWSDVLNQLPSSITKNLPEQPPSDTKTKAGFWREQSSGSTLKRVVRVGDALGFTMPLSGEGIAMAMREGTIAGNILSDGSESSPVFPLTRQTRRQLFNRLVLPYRSQLPRWKRTHWLGMNGSLISRLRKIAPGLIKSLLNDHIPTTNHW